MSIFIVTFYLLFHTLASLTLFKLLVKEIVVCKLVFSQNKILWRKIHNHLKYSSIFYSLHEHFKIQNLCWILFVLINQNYLRNLENIINLLDHVVFFTCHEYVDNFLSNFSLFNYKKFSFFMYLKDVQSFALDFKFYIIQRLNILVKLIAC
jgi:hypothetical protein